MHIRFRFLFVLLALLLGGSLWFAHAQQPGAPARSTGARWLTVHDYGFQVRVEAPAHPAGDWLVRVLDLGADLPHLKKDVLPTAARLQLLGHPPLQLQRQANGSLLARVPSAWLPGGRAPAAQLQVLHHSWVLLNHSIQGLFL
ncbi:MAG: hypothetical protein CMJ94_05865 [Planctomycetes bacterium]|nr:hypothetical protein [Planctomycetota bacterium]